MPKNTKEDYTPRDWAVVDIPFSTKFEDSVTKSPLINSTCGVDSEKAERMSLLIEPFYYDIEQAYAGLNKVYGVSDLFVATKDFILPGGVMVKEGALVFAIHRMDFDAGTRTLLVEKI